MEEIKTNEPTNVTTDAEVRSVGNNASTPKVQVAVYPVDTINNIIQFLNSITVSGLDNCEKIAYAANQLKAPKRLGEE